MKLLLLDNYDSFTWNLAHGFMESGAAVEVVMNDEVSVAQVADGGFDALVISPGPGRPEQAGISLDLVRAHDGRTPLLGVCLGHQAIAQAFGARIVEAPKLMHGKTSPVFHRGSELFRGLSSPFQAMRYHSLMVDPADLDPEVKVTARSDDRVIMAIEHVTRPVYGVQFHPESILTDVGQQLMANFLELVRRRSSRAA